VLVEIKDREKWIEKVDSAIQRIWDKRKKDDQDFERCWQELYYRRSALVRFFLGPSSDKPTPEEWYYREYGGYYPEWGTFYPSIYAQGSLRKLYGIKRALKTNGTGAVDLDGDELRAIETEW
jgi:hypothetical protein